MTGADFSPALLDIARTKAKKEKIDVKFIDGDMRTLKVGYFDAVITIFNAVGHLTKAGFEKEIRNIHNNLKDGGLYVFDIFNLKAMTDEVVAGLAMHTHKKIGNMQIHALQCSSIDKNNGLLISYDSCIIQKMQISRKALITNFLCKFIRQMNLSKCYLEMALKP